MARFVLVAGTTVNPCGKQDSFASEAPPQTVKNHDPGLRFARQCRLAPLRPFDCAQGVPSIVEGRGADIFYGLPKTCFIVTARAIEDV